MEYFIRQIQEGKAGRLQGKVNRTDTFLHNGPTIADWLARSSDYSYNRTGLPLIARVIK